MRSFIVQIIDGSGNLQWVFITASSIAEARTKVNGAGTGWTANLVFEENAPQVSDLLTKHESTTDPFTIQQFSTVQPSGTGAVGGVGIPPDDATIQGPGQQAVASTGESEFRFSQFLRGLQDRGVGTTGVAGRARQNQFQPLQARFLANEALNPGISGTPPTFAQFTQTQPLAGAAAGQDATNLFNQALGLGRGLNPTGAGFEDFTDLQQQLLNPQNAFQAQRFGDLALASARNRLGASAEFLPSSSNFFDRFNAQAGQGALSFGDFLNRRIFGG